MVFSSSPTLAIGSALPHWIDPRPGCDSQSTVVFVKVSNELTSLYLFSGSVLAPPSSDLRDVFSLGFVDDFEDPQLPGWNVETSHNCLSARYSTISSTFTSSDDIKFNGSRSLKVEAASEFGSTLAQPLSGYLTNASEYFVQVRLRT